jgi:hypothetical protein
MIGAKHPMRHLGYWGAGTGNFKQSDELFVQKIFKKHANQATNLMTADSEQNMLSRFH